MGWIHDATLPESQESRWRMIVAISIAFTVLMAIIVALRLYVRRQQFRPDDWIILVTASFSILYNAFTIMQTRYGLGLPLEQRPKGAHRNYTLYNYASRPFYLWGVAGFKLALCVSYMRLTDGTDKSLYRLSIIGVAVFSTVAHTVFVLLNLFSCVPLTKIFHSEIPGHCLQYGPVNYVISTVIILCDVVIFLCPVPLVLALRLERAVKLGLTVAFSMGLLTTLCSILRATYIHQIAYGNGDSSMFVMLSALEINVGIIVSCIPILRPLLRHLPSTLRSAVLSSRRKYDKKDSGVVRLSQYPPTPDERRLSKGYGVRIHSSKARVSYRDALPSSHGDSEDDILAPVEAVAEETTSEEELDRPRGRRVGPADTGAGIMRTIHIDVQQSSLMPIDIGMGSQQPRQWG